MAKKDIAAIRKTYSSRSLLENDVAQDPILQFDKWWKEALDANIDEVNAMTLATASADGLPAARIVLLKAYSQKGFVFFTNYDSYKGRQLQENPKACLVFFWKELERQVRITGFVQKVSEKDSDAYFYSRPAESRIGAVVSPQSHAVPDREWLESQYGEWAQKNIEEIRRPAHWGGYVVVPVMVEFWQGRPARLHDRIEYSLQDAGEWRIQRLAP